MDENYFQYLPVSRSNIEWDLYITGTGVANLIPGSKSYPPKGHPGTYNFTWKKGRVLPEYQIVYISEGKGVFESAEMGKAPVCAGQAIFLFPGDWHRYKPTRGVGWKEHWVSWNGEYLYRLVRRGQLSPKKAILTVGEPDTLLRRFGRIVEMVREHPGENSRVLAAIGMEILALMLESAGEKPVRQAALALQEKHGVEDKLAADAMRIIWSHSYRIHSVQNLVDRLSATRRTLERRFYKAFGRTLGQEITHCRLGRAKHLLESTKLPVEHVALAVGFSSSVRLGKSFQKYEKITPSEYRKKRAKR